MYTNPHLKIVLTGAHGGLARQLLSDWRNSSHEVLALTRHDLGSSSGGPAKISSAKINSDEAKHRILAIDYREPAELESALQNADVVVHAAAKVSNWGRPAEFEQANVRLTEDLLAGAIQQKVKKFIFISTPSLYVSRESRLMIREEDPLPLSSINFYAASKRLAEEKVIAAHRAGLQCVILRPQGIIGQFDRSLLPRFRALGKRGILPVIGGGDTQIDLTFGEDVTQAIECAIQAPATPAAEVYNITSGHPVDLYQHLRHLMREFGYSVREKPLSLAMAIGLARGFEMLYRFSAAEPPLTVYTALTLGTSRTLCIEKARKNLGYNPPLDFHSRWQKLVNDLKEPGHASSTH